MTAPDTPTPETDLDADEDLFSDEFNVYHGQANVVAADFARRIERERDEARAQCDAAVASIRAMGDELALHGLPTGDRDAILAGIRAALTDRDALRRRVAELEAERDALNKRIVEVIRNHDVIGLAYEQRERGDSPFDGIGTPNALLAAQGGSDAAE